jgi:hypothetical protein
MENRLEFFRAQMAAFDGAADPRGAINRGVYVDEPGNSATNLLIKRILLKPNSRNLLLGGVGSGKTTQLLRLESLFQGSEISPHYIDITEYENPESIQAGLLKAVAGLELIAILGKAGVSVDKNVLKSISEYAYGKSEAVMLPSLLLELQSSQSLSENLRSSLFEGLIPSPTVHRKGVLSSNYTKEMDPVDESLSLLVSKYKDNFSKKPFFLFDGLDRINSVKNFIQAISGGLNNIDAGFLIVGPVSLLYSDFTDSLDSYFDYFEYRPAFDVQRDTESYSFFKSIILSRSGDRMFHEKALDNLIQYSGGVFRDLINLAQESIQEAYLSDALIVGDLHVESAVRSLGRAKILGLSDNESEVLARLLNGDELIGITSSEEIALLTSGRILEYRFPNRRIAIHPVLKVLLSSRSLA